MCLKDLVPHVTALLVEQSAVVLTHPQVRVLRCALLVAGVAAAPAPQSTAILHLHWEPTHRRRDARHSTRRMPSLTHPDRAAAAPCLALGSNPVGRSPRHAHRPLRCCDGQASCPAGRSCMPPRAAGRQLVCHKGLGQSQHHPCTPLGGATGSTRDARPRCQDRPVWPPRPPLPVYGGLHRVRTAAVARAPATPPQGSATGAHTCETSAHTGRGPRTTGEGVCLARSPRTTAQTKQRAPLADPSKEKARGGPMPGSFEPPCLQCPWC